MKRRCEVLSPENHPEYEIKETRVSDYLRKYGTGHIEDLPSSSAPEVVDERSVSEMLDSEFEPHMSTESVDIFMEIDRNKDKFEAAIKELELTKTQKEKFDSAVKVLNDPNSSLDSKREAYSILEELQASGKITRARK